MITDHPFNNVTDSIFEKIGVNLHQLPSHPIGIIKVRSRRRAGGGRCQANGAEQEGVQPRAACKQRWSGRDCRLSPLARLLLLQQAIYDYFDEQQPGAFAKFDNLAPIVSAKAVSLAAARCRAAARPCR